MGKPSDLTARARQLRRRETPAERRAWKLLRNRGILGLKFRRQKVLRGFIADFYCAELGLVLELDGPIHGSPEHREYDRQRDAVLQGMGLTVARLSNDEVGRDRLTQILSRAQKPHLHSPSPVHGRGG